MHRRYIDHWLLFFNKNATTNQQSQIQHSSNCNNTIGLIQSERLRANTRSIGKLLQYNMRGRCSTQCKDEVVSSRACGTNAPGCQHRDCCFRGWRLLTLGITARSRMMSQYNRAISTQQSTEASSCRIYTAYLYIYIYILGIHK